MTTRQEAVTQIYQMIASYKLDTAWDCAVIDLPRQLTGSALVYWNNASEAAQKATLSLANQNFLYSIGKRDDYGIWVCPPVTAKIEGYHLAN